MSHPSWLIAHSLNKTKDPVRRGKWIRERLLAGTLPHVPITVDATVPEDPHKTLRERYSVTEAAYCWRCHIRMNPLGNSFEIFDDFGRWRDREILEDLPKEGKDYKSLPVNAKGHLDGTGDTALDGDVTDAIDLLKRLGELRRVQQCIIRHAFRYWMGRNEMLSDSKTLINAEKAYMDKGGSFYCHARLVADFRGKAPRSWQLQAALVFLSPYPLQVLRRMKSPSSNACSTLRSSKNYPSA